MPGARKTGDRKYAFEHLVVLMHSLDLRDVSDNEKERADIIIGWKGDALVILKDRKGRPVRSITRGQYERVRFLSREIETVVAREL